MLLELAGDCVTRIVLIECDICNITLTCCGLVEMQYSLGFERMFGVRKHVRTAGEVIISINHRAKCLRKVSKAIISAHLSFSDPRYRSQLAP